MAWPLQIMRHWWWKPAGPKKRRWGISDFYACRLTFWTLEIGLAQTPPAAFRIGSSHSNANKHTITSTRHKDQYSWEVLTRRPAVKLLEVVSKICRVMRLVLQKHARRPISRLCRGCAQPFQFHSASLFSLALVLRKNALSLSYHILPWYPW